MDIKPIPANVHNNMYRVGEYVYMDSKGSHPYLIRRIEEFIKTPTGVNDVRVTIVYRRRDISTAILRVADGAERDWPDYLEYDDETGEELPGRNIKREVANGQALIKKNLENGEKEHDKLENGNEIKNEEADSMEKNEKNDEEIQPFDWGLGGLPFDAQKLTEEERYRLRQREVFHSRKEERLSVSHIRGKCSVNLLCDVETSGDYLNRDDSYFYSLVYDREKLSMLADKGAIRVGSQYQAVVPEYGDSEEQMEIDGNKENGDLVIDEEEPEKESTLDGGPGEIQVWKADNGLAENDIDRFLIHVRAIGVFARVIDPNSATKYPSAQMIAAIASKDSTILYAMGLLHKAEYDLTRAQDRLVPPADMTLFPKDVDENMGFNTVTLGGPLLVRDQLEEYSAAESCLFEEGLERIGKDFADIRAQVLPWKSLQSLIEYYYLYKTTNRYIDGRKKRLALEKDNKLLQVYVPNVPQESSAFVIGSYSNTGELKDSEKGCTGCQTTSSVNWFKWGHRSDDVQLCQTCWDFWRHYGGLSIRHKLDHYDTDIAADPDVAQGLLKTLSYATPSCSKTAYSKDPKRYGANSYTMYTVVSAADLNMAGAAGLNMLNGGNQKNSKAHINLKTNLFTKMARRALPKEVLSVKRCGRTPFTELDWQKVSDYMAKIDQDHLCGVMKAIVAPQYSITPSAFQSCVSNLMSEFAGGTKRSASVELEGQPPAKKAAPTPAD